MKTKIFFTIFLFLFFINSINSENYPDEETIKSDLIGKKVSSNEGSWNFESLMEFKGFSIMNSVKTKSVVEYKIQLILQKINSQSLNNVIIYVVYKKTSDKWRFVNINLLKYENLSQSNKSSSFEQPRKKHPIIGKWKLISGEVNNQSVVIKGTFSMQFLDTKSLVEVSNGSLQVGVLIMSENCTTNSSIELKKDQYLQTIISYSGYDCNDDIKVGDTVIVDYKVFGNRLRIKATGNNNHIVGQYIRYTD